MPIRKPTTEAPATWSFTGTTTGAAVDTAQYYEFDKFITVTGTFTATLKVEISNDNTTWVQSGSDITAAGVTTISARAKFIRVRCSAYTSGTAVASMYGVKTVPEY